MEGHLCPLQALQEEYRPDMTLKEAEVLALSTLKQVMEEKVRVRAAAAVRPERLARMLPHVMPRMGQPCGAWRSLA